MKFRVGLGPDGGDRHDVDLPPLRTGRPARAVVDGEGVEFELLPPVAGEEAIAIAGKVYLLRDLPPLLAGRTGGASFRLLFRGRPVEDLVESEAEAIRSRIAVRPGGGGPWIARSPLPGVVRQVLVARGDRVEEGAPLLTVEAMKMENEVRAESGGVVAEVFVSPGQSVEANAPLVRLLGDGHQA